MAGWIVRASDHRFKLSSPLSSGAMNRVALRYYIDFFNFSGLRLDHAFRQVFFFRLKRINSQ